jgi:surface protein
MQATFREASTFKGDGLENWDVSSVVNMQSMFDTATRFQGNLTTWQTVRVYDFSWMFIECRLFNSDLSKWDTSSATTMASMVRSETQLVSLEACTCAHVFIVVLV